MSEEYFFEVGLAVVVLAAVGLSSIVVWAWWG